MSVFLVACAATTQVRPDPTREPGFLPPVQIEVASDVPSPITVYLVQGEQRRRLGTVEPAGQGHFRLPGRLVFTDQQLLLVAESLDRTWTVAGEPFVTQPGGRPAFQLDASRHLWRRPE
jgi:hypothetical protein